MSELLYTKFLSQMNQAQLHTVVACCNTSGITDLPIDESDIDAVALATELEKTPHVDVVVACSGVDDPQIIEILMSQPMTRDFPQKAPKAPKAEKVGRTPKPTVVNGVTIVAPSPSDTRIIAKLAPNPKKPSSASYARYALYEVGQSVADFIKAGGTKGDVQYDAGKGFIELVDAKDYVSATE